MVTYDVLCLLSKEVQPAVGSFFQGLVGGVLDDLNQFPLLAQAAGLGTPVELMGPVPGIVDVPALQDILWRAIQDIHADAIVFRFVVPVPQVGQYIPGLGFVGSGILSNLRPT